MAPDDGPDACRGAAVASAVTVTAVHQAFPVLQSGHCWNSSPFRCLPTFGCCLRAMLTADARWTRLSLLLLALGAAPAFAGALQQAIVAAPARNNGVPLPGVAPPLANAAPGAPIGRVLNAQHDIANEVRARQGLVAAAQARGQRQGAFLSCPAGLRPWCVEPITDALTRPVDSHRAHQRTMTTTRRSPSCLRCARRYAVAQADPRSASTRSRQHVNAADVSRRATSPGRSRGARAWTAWRRQASSRPRAHPASVCPVRPRTTNPYLTCPQRPASAALRARRWAASRLKLD